MDERREGEARLKNVAKARGYEVIDPTGWPDFLLYKNGTMFGVEVKRHTYFQERIHLNQAEVFNFLEEQGIYVMIAPNGEIDHMVPWREWPISYYKKEEV